MKKQLINLSIFGIVAVLLFPSCKKDYINPNAATEEQVFSSPQGLTGVAVGLQRVYTAGRGSSLYNVVTINGLITKELIVLNQGNTGEYQLQLGGGSVDGTNTLMSGLWTSSNKIIYDADKVIEGAKALTDKNYASGLIGYASLFKALALGNLSMFWEKVPEGIGVNVSFIDRAQGFAKAITTIDEALAAINANAISAAFTANVPVGINIPNALHALKARYSLFTGNYAQALTEANAASLTVKSTFNFTTVNLNPIFETATSTNNVTAADNVTFGLPAGLQPDAGDKRLPFYTTTAYNSKILGFAAASTTPWPVYLPGEMILIKAEAYARQNDLVNALIELNKVVTKTPASDAYGVGADLPPLVGLTQAQILEQIYKHRSIELFMSGLKLEDMRRFARPNAERTRNLLPYPFLERDNNPNTPPDPAF
ncbi:MAG TPA: RagB/SusD family nutrient uptake outer membrane protein [Chitinophagaceae bacterium]|nr:RagB/SusD family nutrient uptake outer membrane protein [Chitinophagaceae bacterium]